MDKLIRAIYFAAVAHRNQRRKDASSTPYINHPIEVMKLLSKAGVTDVDTLCAAVLHDTIEDVGVTYEQLDEKFGGNVANIVRECSDNKSLPKVVRKQEQIKHAETASMAAKLVKAADKLSNLSDLALNPPAKWSTEEINGYFVWSYMVWKKIEGCNLMLDVRLFALFQQRGITRLTQEEQNAQLEKYYKNIDKSD